MDMPLGAGNFGFGLAQGGKTKPPQPAEAAACSSNPAKSIDIDLPGGRIGHLTLNGDVWEIEIVRPESDLAKRLRKAAERGAPEKAKAANMIRRAMRIARLAYTAAAGAGPVAGPIAEYSLQQLNELEAELQEWLK